MNSNEVTAILSRLPSILVNELMWGFAGIFISAIVTLLVLRVLLGLNLKEIVHEVEEDQNIGVGAAFFVCTTAIGLLIGRAFQSAPEETSFVVSLVWLMIAAGMIITSGTATCFVFLLPVSRRKKESIIAYLRREVVVENNGALMLFLGGIFMMFTLIIGQITL